MNKHSIAAGIASLILITTLSACSQDQTATDAEPASTPASAASSSTTPSSSTADAESSEPEELMCLTCGVISSITPIEVAGASTGAGAAAGALIGGLAGNQVGGGSGNTIATVAGVIGGAVVGNTVERNRNTQTVYEVVVEMDSGRRETITVPDITGISPGSAVTVQGTSIYLR
jgi:outer membrane lipoprotein SlyB